ncbi:hypothetical protein HYS00_02090, partial [Candidatus Microgenomates bacterium]|nr:hypothetical protein [Candidatus Microgenomates bacterium]
IIKANPETLVTEKVFTPKDGLNSTEGYRLTSAADAVWFSTQNGVGRIDTKTNTVTFTDRGLGIKSPQVSTGTILFDGDHVWVQIVANTQSMGGIALLDKTTGKWTGFDSDNLQDRVIGKVDLEGIKLVPGGIQIAFRDGRVNQTERLVEKEYQYESGIWKKLSDKPTTGDGGIPTYEYMRTAYPQPPVYTLPSANGLTIMRNPVTGQSYGTNGRRNYILSPMIVDKRYLLTSATIDIIQDSSPFNKILIPLGEGIGLEQSFANVAQYQQTIQFAIDPASLIGLVTDSACGPTGCTDHQKAWLVDLKSEQLLRVYTSADLLPGGKILTGLHLTKKGSVVEVYNKLGLRVFTIDLSDYHLTPLSTIKPAA